jgi:uncharacterized protein (TIGR00661 family)
LKKPKRILVAPLNWGLGHATRCIPIINKLLEFDFEVLLASDGRSLKLLQKELPDLQTVELPAYDIRYSTNNMVFNIAFQIPKILAAIWKEDKLIKKVVEKEEINIIISDNRFGCKSKNTKNIFITHQINIITPFKPLEWLVNKINHFLINSFDECWIPDYEGQNSLAGRLSKVINIKNAKYLGALSRMEKIDIPIKYDIIAVISGPEPQRTHFEKIITRELKTTHKKCLVVQGKTDVFERFKVNDKIEIVSFLNSKELNKAIQASELVICRSGYSSIMDLVKLNKKAILVPTPGQTEQEYLADRLKENDLFGIQLQETFSLKKELEEIENYNIRQEERDTSELLNEAILSLKNQILQKHLA